MSNAFPQELRLIKDIISGQYLWERKNWDMLSWAVSYRKLQDVSQTELNTTN